MSPKAVESIRGFDYVDRRWSPLTVIDDQCLRSDYYHSRTTLVTIHMAGTDRSRLKLLVIITCGSWTFSTNFSDHWYRAVQLVAFGGQWAPSLYAIRLLPSMTNIDCHWYRAVQIVTTNGHRYIEVYYTVTNSRLGCRRKFFERTHWSIIMVPIGNTVQITDCRPTSPVPWPVVLRVKVKFGLLVYAWTRIHIQKNETVTSWLQFRSFGSDL